MNELADLRSKWEKNDTFRNFILEKFDLNYLHYLTNEITYSNLVIPNKAPKMVYLVIFFIFFFAYLIFNKEVSARVIKCVILYSCYVYM
jgi:hypothetical protein